MEERLSRLEKALEEVRAENRLLREEVRVMQERLADVNVAAAMNQTEQAPTTRKLWGRWSVVTLIASLILVPMMALSVLHMSAFESTAVGAMNALLLYIVGPGAWRLLTEGLVRAIPAVLFGQATRIAVDKWRGNGGSKAG